MYSLLAISCFKSTMKTLGQGVKHVHAFMSSDMPLFLFLIFKVGHTMF